MFSNEEIDTNVKNCKMKQFVKIVSVFLEVGGGGVIGSSYPITLEKFTSREQEMYN